jgi:alpha-beta hydrolase superfamily lysophospholipase
MAEHAGRYARVAAFLADAGFACYLHDHPGQGPEAAKTGRLGVYPERTWEESLHRLKSRVEGIPVPGSANHRVILLGHSWGSFLVQDYIHRWGDEIDGAILCGTDGWKPGIGLLFGRFLSFLACRFKGPDQPAALLDRLVFGSFNRQFRPNRTEYDWISRDPGWVDSYVADPYCGQVVSNRFYHELFLGLWRLWYSAEAFRVPPQFPVLIVAGTDDPVSGTAGKGIRRLVSRLQEKGACCIRCRLVEGGRHELLGDSDFAIFTQILVDWLQ